MKMRVLLCGVILGAVVLTMVIVGVAVRSNEAVAFSAGGVVAFESDAGGEASINLSGSAGGGLNFDYYASDVACFALSPDATAVTNVGKNERVAEVRAVTAGVHEVRCEDRGGRPVDLELVY